MFGNDWTKRKSSIYIETARNVWKWLNQTTVRRSDGDETLICLQGISEKLPRTMWVNKNEHRPVRFPPRSNRLTFFSTQVVPFPWTFCHRKLHWTATYYTRTIFFSLSPKSSISCISGVQRPAPAKASFCIITPVHTGPRSQNRTYRNRTSKSWTVLPTVPIWSPVTFGLFLQFKERLAGWKFVRV